MLVRMTGGDSLVRLPRGTLLGPGIVAMSYIAAYPDRANISLGCIASQSSGALVNARSL